MIDNVRSAALLLVLLNPFLLIIYLVGMVESLDRKQFSQVMFRAGLISGTVFCCFAILGDAIFSGIVHAEFASFQIFGGIVFLLIALQFVFQGPKAIEILQGKSEHLAGAVAMPVLIGPGTISASVIIGKRHEPLGASLTILVTVAITVVLIILLKHVHDIVRPRREQLVKRYIEIAGRIMALVVGTVSIDMIMQGVRVWSLKF